METEHISKISEEELLVKLQTIAKPFLLCAVDEGLYLSAEMINRLESYAASAADKLKVFSINLSDCTEVEKMFNIRSLPSLLVIKNGVSIGATVGIPQDNLISKLVKQSILTAKKA